MNIEELFRDRFGPESAQELGQVLGIDAEPAARLLDRAVRSQLETVAQHAKSEVGRAQILDAIANLPQFRDVRHALSEQGGASSLRLAGELLSPVLLGQDQSDLAGKLSRVEGVPQPAITALMNMSLPLLLSFIGQAGVNESSVTGIMSTLRASGVRPRAAGGSYVSRAAANARQFVDEGRTAAGETKKSPEAEKAPVFAQTSGSDQAQHTSGMSAAGMVPSQPVQPGQTPFSEAGQSSPSQPESAQSESSQPESARPELAQDTDYSKSSVVSALLDGAEVPEPGAVQRGSQPPALTASFKENPYRTHEDAGDASEPQPELAQDTDYSKSSVVSALLDGAEMSTQAGVATPAAPPAPSVSERPAAPEPVVPEPVVPEPVSTPTQPAQAGKGTEAERDQKVERVTPSADRTPAPQQGAVPGAVSPEALAAAAAAAGVGAGAVGAASRPVAQPAGGNPWKSAKPVVVGSQPSPTTASAASTSASARGPQAVPVQPQVSAPAPGSVTASEALTADSLASAFREQFSGQGVGALAEATGFAGRDASRAVQGTAAVLLGALAQKGRDEAGAAELLELSQDFGRVTEQGRLNTGLLGNRAELGALEVRGLSVLERLLDNPGQVGGRLGTALGTSGEQAGRLLALLTPFALGLLGSRARAGRLDAAGLSRVLGGLDAARLQGLLPEGLGSLKSLLGMQLFGAAPKERATLLQTKQAKAAPVPGAPVPSAPVSSAAVTETVVADKPAAPVQPLTPEPPRPVTPPPAPPERRGGFPWWLLLLPLLAGLAWYFTQDRETPISAPATSAATTSEASTVPAAESGIAPAPGTVVASQVATSPATATASDADVAAVTDDAVTDDSVAGVYSVTSPVAGETVPDTGFTMSGTGEPAATYQLLEDGVSVGTFVSEADGTWQADVAAPAAGEHVYSVQDSAGAEVISVPVTVEATAAAATCSEPLTLSVNDGETVNAPFRFGGVGDASGYQVRVLRGSEEIGAVDISLAPNCTWNYLSQPGGEAGTAEAITYEVRSLDDLGGAPLQTINLNVVQAGQ